MKTYKKRKNLFNNVDINTYTDFLNFKEKEVNQLKEQRDVKEKIDELLLKKTQKENK
jgi:hypothetical protein